METLERMFGLLVNLCRTVKPVFDSPSLPLPPLFVGVGLLALFVLSHVDVEQ